MQIQMDFHLGNTTDHKKTGKTRYGVQRYEEDNHRHQGHEVWYRAVCRKTAAYSQVRSAAVQQYEISKMTRERRKELNRQSSKKEATCSKGETREQDRFII
jgi:hypothetical protein